MTTYFGWMTRIWLSRYGVHFWISSGRGSRFLGSLHFKMLPMKKLCLANSISDSSVSRNFPATPTNGFPYVFPVSRRFSNKHDLAFWTALAWNSVFAGLPKFTFAANYDPSGDSVWKLLLGQEGIPHRFPFAFLYL